jgi:hypothetical protein
VVIDHDDMDIPNRCANRTAARALMPLPTVISKSVPLHEKRGTTDDPDRSPHPDEAEMFWRALPER